MRKQIVILAIFAFATANAGVTPVVTQRTAAAAGHCTSGTMSNPYYLKITGISGESRDACHTDEIELISYRSAGNSFTITKKIDSTSPRLFLAALERKSFQEATLTVIAQTLVIQYELKGAVINSFEQNANSGIETVIFSSTGLLTKTQNSTATAPSPRGAGAASVSVSIAGTVSSASQFTDGVSGGTMRDFYVSKTIDAASPRLKTAAMSGEPVPEITFTLRAGSDTFLYKLSNVQVRNLVQANQNETMNLKASRFTLEYHSPSKPANSVHTGWDVKANAKV